MMHNSKSVHRSVRSGCHAIESTVIQHWTRDTAGRLGTQSHQLALEQALSPNHLTSAVQMGLANPNPKSGQQTQQTQQTQEPVAVTPYKDRYNSTRGDGSSQLQCWMLAGTDVCFRSRSEFDPWRSRHCWICDRNRIFRGFHA